MAKWLVTNPVGQITLLVGVIAGAVGIYNLFTKSVAEAQKTLEEFNQVCSDLQGVKDNLTRIDEQIKAIQDKGTLSLTDEADLSRLEQERKLLEKEIELLELKKELLADKSNNDAVKAVNDGSYKKGDGFFDNDVEDLINTIKIQPTFFDAYSEEIRNNAKQIYTDAKVDLADLQRRNVELLGQITGDDEASVNARKELQEYIDYVNQYLYTAEELQKMKFDDFLNENEKIKKSFDDLSNNGANVTADNIENLANKFPTLKSYMDENGISAETLVAEFAKVSDEAENSDGNINEMAVSLDALKDASDSIATLQKAFDEMSEDGYITTETLSKIKEAVGDNIDNWDEYRQKLLTAKAGSAEFKQILSDLTYAIIENKFETKGLENATEEEVAAILRENGVLNANEVAHGMVTRAKAEAILKAHDFASASETDTKNLYKQLTALGLSESAIKSLASAYAEAQASMDKILAEGVESRLGIMKDELKSVKSIADAYALLGRGYDSNQDDTIDYVGSELYRLSPKEKEKYLAAREQILAYGKAQEEIQKILDEFDKNVRYSGSKSTDKDKPDKADPTDAIINRIASDVEALERQGEIIDNQLDMVDAEKEYDKYVELTNKALDNRLKTIEASKTAQNELSKEAQKIRDKYKGIDVESFFYANGGFTEAYDKYYESFGSKAKQEAFADDMKMIQEFKKAWFEYYDDIMGLEKEVFDLRKELQEAHYDHLSNLIDQLERHADLREKQAEDDKEHYDYLIDKEQALLDMKKAQFGLENKLTSARREAEKALATSKIGSEYLDEETRKLVYNEDDYKLEMDKIDEISDYVDGLTEDYIADINALGEDEMYKAEEITAQYERRIALKEKELEIVQAEIDLQKKQDIFNNVLAEKNIRQIVDGKWVWTHDTDKLRQANEDLEDAKAQVEQLEREKEQLKYTNSLEARIGQWQLEQEAIDVAMKNLQEQIDDFSTKLELLKDPLQDFGAIVKELTAELGSVSISGYGNTDSSSGKSSSGSGRIGSANPNVNAGSVVQQMMNNSTMWHVSDSATKAQLHATNQKLAASIGADYNPSNGKYYQNGKPLYDSGGVLKGLGGIKATEKDEIVLPPDITSNILNPEKNALFDTFTNNLDTIFNPDLMPIQQIPFNIPQPNLKLLDTVTNRNTVVNYNMNGDVNINEAEDGNRLLQSLTNKIKSMPIPN